MCNWRDDESAVVFKADRSAIEQMVDAWRQQEPVLTIQPLLVGRIAPGLAMALSSEVEGGHLPGAVIAIVRKGRLAYFESVGFQDPDAKIPMPRYAIFSIASITKPMVSVAVMILHDEGKLSFGA